MRPLVNKKPAAFFFIHHPSFSSFSQGSFGAIIDFIIDTDALDVLSSLKRKTDTITCRSARYFRSDYLDHVF